jgi:hypothetical protein
MSLPRLGCDALPNHWGLLAPDDQREYLALRVQFRETIAKSRRGERIDVFVERLKAIRSFINKDPATQWKRSLVCGVIFLKTALAINIQQLKTFIGKCKSSINGSLQHLSYISKPATHAIDEEIIRLIPLLSTDRSEMKKWTVRIGTFPDEENPIEIREETGIETQSAAPPEAEEVQKIVQWAFPCPAKCRHKFQDILYCTAAIQTEM